MLKIELETSSSSYDSCSNWEVVSRVGRHINGIQGILIRQHYPGMVTYAGVTSPPLTWDHFYATEGNEFGTVAAWIKAEFWVSLHRTKLINTTDSLVVLEIMKRYMMFAYRTSSGATKGLRTGWCKCRTRSTGPDSRTCTTRCGSTAS